MSDAEHWLFRLTAAQWLAAAQVELARAREQITSRRTSLTHARRGGGMALNALLVHHVTSGGDPETAQGAWGRSYIDHLRALASDAASSPVAVPPTFGHLAQVILRTPVAPSPGQLVQLSPGPTGTAPEEVLEVIEAASELTAQCAQQCKAADSDS